MIYETKDGMIFKADTPEELVRQLHETSQAPAEDDAAWMEQTAKRTYEVSGALVRWDSATRFVDDLIEAGMLMRSDK